MWSEINKHCPLGNQFYPRHKYLQCLSTEKQHEVRPNQSAYSKKKRDDSLFWGKIKPRASVWLDPSVLLYVSCSIPFRWKTTQKLEKKKTTSITSALVFQHTDLRDSEMLRILEWNDISRCSGSFLCLQTVCGWDIWTRRCSVFKDLRGRGAHSFNSVWIL